MSRARETPRRHRVVVEHDVPMVTRDGVTLRADVHRPDAPGTFPVLLQRTPYGKASDSSGVRIRQRDVFPQLGYVVVVQDTRGRYSSDGEFRPFVHEGDDGRDAVAWASRLPWSDGRVGMVGQSYAATCQYLAAPGATALRAAVPVSGPVSFLQTCLHRDGVLEVPWALAYLLSMARPTTGPGAADDSIWARVDEILVRPDLAFSPLTTEALGRVPIRALVDELGSAGVLVADVLDHPTYDAHWSALDTRRRCGDIDVPMLHVSSWFDAFQADTLAMFTGLRDGGWSASTRAAQHLVMGPWAHQMSFAEPVPGTSGDLEVSADTDLDLYETMRRWLDVHLLDLPPDELELPPVRIFVIGDDRWRDEDEWPLRRTRYTEFQLHSEGHANSRFGDGTLSQHPPAPDEPPDCFLHDPNRPVPTLGGAVVGLPAGIRDHRRVEERADVLVYTSEPLPSDLEVTGPVRLHLYAASTAPDTDFVARLLDVHPDGYSGNVVEGIVRTRFRESLSRPRLHEPDVVYDYDVDLWSTSYVFAAGHRLRVQICSSSFPRWLRNPNTGGDPVEAVRLVPAAQTVFHDVRRQSRIVLPVVPR